MKRLYVGNLPYQVSEADVQNAFAVYGPVRSCSIVRDRETGQSRGFAFVEMENDENALAAINGLNGQQLDGRALTVNEARPPQRSGGGGGYRGGAGGMGRGGGGVGGGERADRGRERGGDGGRGRGDGGRDRNRW